MFICNIWFPECLSVSPQIPLIDAQEKYGFPPVLIRKARRIIKQTFPECQEAYLFTLKTKQLPKCLCINRDLGHGYTLTSKEFEYLPGDEKCWDIDLNRKYQLCLENAVVFEFKREDLAKAQAIEDELSYRESVFGLFEEYLIEHETLEVVLDIKNTYVFLGKGVVAGFSNPTMVPTLW